MQNNTVLAILSIFIIAANAARLFFDGDPTTFPDWGSVITQILIALGVIQSVDVATAKKNSREN